MDISRRNRELGGVSSLAMKKILIAVLVVAIVGFGSIFLYFSNQDNELKVSADNIDSSNTKDSIGETGNPDGIWTTKKQQDVFVGYEIEELFGGESVKKTASAKTKELTGILTITDSKITQAKITADLTQLESDSQRRDSIQETQGLETIKFKTATFEIKKPLDLGKVEKKKEISLEIPGDLTLHGVTNPVSFPVTAIWDGKVIKISGDLEIQLSEYEIEPPKNSIVSVNDSGKIKFQLLFVPNS